MGEDTEGLKREIDDTRGELSRDVDALTEKVSPTRVLDRGVHRAKNRLSRTRDRIMGSAQDASSAAGGKVASAGQSVAETASSAAEGVAGAAGGAADTVRQKAQGNPMAAGLIAFGTGWLVSSVLPASTKEAELADRAVESAKEHGQPIAREAASIGADVGDQLKRRAGEAAESVKSTAADAASTVTEEGRSSLSSAEEARS